MLLRALRFRRIDWPLAILMVIAWTVIAVYGAGYIERAHCARAGGRLVQSGMDRLCIAADGSSVQVRVIPSTAIGWVGVIAVYGAAIAVSYSFLAGWIRRPRDP
jgi:hypothetical protein